MNRGCLRLKDNYFKRYHINQSVCFESAKPCGNRPDEGDRAMEILSDDEEERLIRFQSDCHEPGCAIDIYQPKSESPPEVVLSRFVSMRPRQDYEIDSGGAGK